MANFIEFFRMVFSYLVLFVIIAGVSAAGGFVGVKFWKQKEAPQVTEKDTNA